MLHFQVREYATQESIADITYMVRSIEILPTYPQTPALAIYDHMQVRKVYSL